MASSPPRIQASIPRPPPMAERMKGMVMNGPIPTMSIMFRAMPRQRPISRLSSDMGRGSVLEAWLVAGTYQLPQRSNDLIDHRHHLHVAPRGAGGHFREP